MPVQTSVLDVPLRGYEGQIVYPAMPMHRMSAIIEATANPAAPGKLFFRGTADNQARTIINAGTITPANVLGVSMYEDSRPPNDYGDKRPVTLLRRGMIYVLANAAVTDGAPVSYGNTTGNLDEWATAVDADHVLVVAARWASSALAGEIAAIEINFLGLAVP
jgi:hypothetical protein